MAKITLVEEATPNVGNSRGFIRETPNINANFTELYQMSGADSTGVEVVTTTNVIAASEQGKTFYLNSATGFVSTLPAAAAGLRFKFVISLAVTTTAGHTIVCPAAATLFKGHVLTNDVNSATDADFGTSGEATVTFVINKAIAGDRVTVECDGTNWFVEGASSVFDAITIS